MKSDPQGPREPALLGFKETVWLLSSAAGLLLVYLSPLREHLTHAQAIKADLQALGKLAPLVFVVVMSALTAMGIPRMVIYPIGGLAFGFANGLLWSMVATLVGAYATFLYARWAGRDFLLNKWPTLRALSARLQGRGPLAVALLRQLPNPAFLTNVLFGISPVGHQAFLVGTAAGSLPAAVPATLIGSSLGKASPETRLWYIALTVASMPPASRPGGDTPRTRRPSGCFRTRRLKTLHGFLRREAQLVGQDQRHVPAQVAGVRIKRREHARALDAHMGRSIRHGRGGNPDRAGRAGINKFNQERLACGAPRAYEFGGARRGQGGEVALRIGVFAPVFGLLFRDRAQDPVKKPGVEQHLDAGLPRPVEQAHFALGHPPVRNGRRHHGLGPGKARRQAAEQDAGRPFHREHAADACAPGAGARAGPTARSTPSSTVNPGPNARAAKVAPSGSFAAAIMAFSTNSTVALLILP